MHPGRLMCHFQLKVAHLTYQAYHTTEYLPIHGIWCCAVSEGNLTTADQKKFRNVHLGHFLLHFQPEVEQPLQIRFSSSTRNLPIRGVRSWLASEGELTIVNKKIEPCIQVLAVPLSAESGAAHRKFVSCVAHKSYQPTKSLRMCTE